MVVDISSVLEQKIDALSQHTSQMYEWLPYNGRRLDQVPEGEPERRAWLGERYKARNASMAEKYRAELVCKYGEAKGSAAVAVEVFEGSEYGSP